MNIVFFTKDKGRVGSITLNRPLLVTAMLAVFVVIPLLSLYAGMEYGRDEARENPGEYIVDMQQQLDQQQSQVSHAIALSEENMNALALQLGKLQAHVLRLDALGQRLTKMAKLDKGEFDFDHAPALGGPESGYEQQTMPVENFMQTLDDLSQQLADREQQLTVLETMLMNRNLLAEVYPTGRPVKGGWLSSHYGMRTDPFTGRREFHKGIDFAGKAGSEVVAVAAGVVTWAGERYGYGNLVEVTHGNGYATRYGHNRKILVKVGDKVVKNQILAKMGSSGRSTGPHVHFEVYHNGKPVNPSKYIRASR
jgi:murein DD-endopeptidase MepM/ murein hydrolase activator NlpD